MNNISTINRLKKNIFAIELEGFFYLKKAMKAVVSTLYSSNLIKKTLLISLTLLALGGTVYFEQEAKFSQLLWVQRHHQLYYLPQPSVLKRLSLGYKTFLADLIWIRGLIYVGTHFSKERGSIEWLPRYVESIVQLDPKFRKAYIWGSILILYNRTKTTREDVEISLKILLKAREQFPYDYYFPYQIGMLYLYEFYLGNRSLEGLKEDYRRFCRKPVPKGLLAKKLELIEEIKKCKKKIAASYLLEASEKENAPSYLASLASSLMKAENPDNFLLCQHLFGLLWRTENSEVRKKVREKIRKSCGNKYSKRAFCIEKVLFQSWKREFPYLPRTLYQLLKIPPGITDYKPITYPLPSPPEQKCFQTSSEGRENR